MCHHHRPGEDSFVITSRQRRIDWCLQCAFQGLVHGPFLESIILFSSWKEDSLYPASRCRATMGLSPHPKDIRVRLVDMSVPWQTTSPIVKDTFLTELVGFLSFTPPVDREPAAWHILVLLRLWVVPRSTHCFFVPRTASGGAPCARFCTALPQGDTRFLFC